MFFFGKLKKLPYNYNFWRSIVRRLLKRTLAALIVLSLYAMTIVSWKLFQAFRMCDQQSNQKRVTISQGVSGTVCFWQGDFMPIMQPSQGLAGQILDFLDIFDLFRIKPHHGTIRPVVREIYISQVITVKQMSDSDSAQPRGDLFSVIPAKIVATTSSDKGGFYQLQLPVGTYSIFVKENNAFYANKFDVERRIAPFEVFPQSVTRMPIDITYESYE